MENITFLKRSLLFLYILLPAITGVAALNWLAAIPSDSQRVVWVGMTSSRLLIAGLLFFAATGFTLLAIFAWRQTGKTIRWLEDKLTSQRFLVLTAISSGAFFFAAWIFLAIPDKYLGELWGIEARLRPLVCWVLLLSFQILAGVIGWQINKQIKQTGSLINSLLPASLAAWILLSIWVFIAVTKLGLTGANSFWSKAGVPVLWPQVLLSLVIALFSQFLLTRFTKISSKQIWLDAGLCTLIWLSAIILWNNQGYVQGVFNTQPRPPTNEIYPINDSLTYDLSAQGMLIGRALTSETQDKPLFITHLAILHALAGTSYFNFYILQIISFAFIPVVGYYLGKNLHSRPLGIMFAALLVIKEKNAIALTNYIHVSTSKMILSEMLTTLGVLLFTLFLVWWLKNPQRSNSNLWLAGGVLGLTSLARLNAIGILPVTVILIGLALKFRWKAWVTASILIGAFVVVSSAPWIARNLAQSGNAFNFIQSKTNGVIVNKRYNPLIEESAPTQNDAGNQAPASRMQNYLVLGQGIATNYFHNLIGITIMLPPSLELFKLLDLVRLPYWRTEWDGSLLPGAFWIILGVLIFTALGIASAWKRWRAGGLAPLAVILGYNLTTAISLTSGGRYLVPMDWGVLFYFSIGLFDAATWLLTLFGWRVPSEPVAPQKPDLPNRGFASRLLVTCLAFLFIGSLPIILETLPPERYPATVSVDDFLKANQTQPEFSQKTMLSITSLSKDPLARVFYGRTLYPRYFGENKGDGPTLDEDALIGSAGFDRLSFFLLGRADETTVLLPISARPSSSISGADTWGIGCQRTNHVEAIIVVFRANGIVRVYQQEPFKTACQ
jgi:hypothetical protein